MGLFAKFGTLFQPTQVFGRISSDTQVTTTLLGSTWVRQVLSCRPQLCHTQRVGRSFEGENVCFQCTNTFAAVLLLRLEFLSSRVRQSRCFHVSGRYSLICQVLALRKQQTLSDVTSSLPKGSSFYEHTSLPDHTGWSTNLLTGTVSCQ